MLSDHRVTDKVSKPAEGRHWYAVYTRARHEKAVHSQLSRRKVETFLPLVDVPRRWSDRWKKVPMPLFPGYLFARVPTGGWVDVLKIPGVVQFVGNQAGPLRVPDDQVDAVRRALISELRCDPHPFLSEGQRVRVVSGPLRGFEGILVRKKSQYRLVVTVELIRRAVALEISAADVAAA